MGRNCGWKEEHRNGQELWLKVEKDQEQHKKTIIWIKGRAVKFHKSSITYWAKAVLQPKNSNSLQLWHSQWA